VMVPPPFGLTPVSENRLRGAMCPRSPVHCGPFRHTRTQCSEDSRPLRQSP
jgi:hypothetical protein